MTKKIARKSKRPSPKPRASRVGSGNSSASVIRAAEAMDWGQVVMNGGPACFHVEGGRFCGRAQRWMGHDEDCRAHVFVSLADLLRSVSLPNIKT